MPPKMSSIFGRFVLQEVESQTKCCYSLKVKIFGPSQKFGLATPLETTIIKLAFFCRTFLFSLGMEESKI